MFQRFARPRILVVAAGLGMVLATPLAGRANEPNLILAPTALPRMEHVLGSGGLGSRLEETVMFCAPFALPAHRHLMGSGGLGSQLEETLIPAGSGNC
jgi:hypothetical protein